MSKTRNLHNGIACGLVVTMMAVLLLAAVRAEAGNLLTRGIVVGGVAYGVNKYSGELVDVAESTLSAAIEGDEDKAEAGLGKARRVLAKGALESFPVIAVGFAVAERVRTAKERVKSFFSGVGEAVTDARAALAINRDEREWYEREAKVLDPQPLSVVKKRHFVEPAARATAASPDPWSNQVGGNPSGVGGSGQGESYEDEALVQAHAWGCWNVRVSRFSPDYPTWRARMQRRQATGASVDCREKKDEWGTVATPSAGTGQAESEHGGSPSFKERVEEERRARPQCYGIVSDPTAAECERDPWAAEGKVEERVTSGEPGARDGQWDKGSEWARREDESRKSVEESQSEYAEALSATLGSDQPGSTDGDYMAALRDLEKQEEERKAREEAERRRMEEERRAREVAERRRIEEERRARRSSQGWPGNYGGSASSGSSGSERRGRSYSPVPCCTGYACCCDGGWGCGTR